jgi:catechol 2,3-dioxygenase-like lactoylglutathione lyase family enzyme
MSKTKSDDTVPPVAIGHVRMTVKNIDGAVGWFADMGLRTITARDTFAVLELRGGTHLVLNRTDRDVDAGTPAPFDLMVDDVDAAHAACAGRGLAPGEITEGSVHRSFHVPGPDGYSIKITSSHTGSRAV